MGRENGGRQNLAQPVHGRNIPTRRHSKKPTQSAIAKDAPVPDLRARPQRTANVPGEVSTAAASPSDAAPRLPPRVQSPESGGPRPAAAVGMGQRLLPCCEDCALQKDTNAGSTPRRKRLQQLK